MLTTSRAIVLRAVRHGDRSLIVTAHTQAHGLRAFVVRPGKRGGLHANLFQPLARLELVWDERPERELAVVREARVENPYRHATTDPVAGALILFVQEVLLRTLKGESMDGEMHRYLQDSLEVLDHATDHALFPQLFLLGLARVMGFLPEPPEGDEDNFDLLEGRFITGEAPSGHTLRPPLSTALARLVLLGPSGTGSLTLPAAVRKPLLDHLLFYFRMHLDGLRELRSPGVLHQVLA